MKTKFIKGDLVKSLTTGMVVEVVSCNKISFVGTVIEVGENIFYLGQLVPNLNLESFEKK